ncbi:unnamed protein product [Rangifer tarandus platyrhynchus]|uniref:Uncharacterized protein n=1 Tax=Rangifer tarandus platyrhynchus TaxID=3082113 RepID=A0ABN8ZPN5_RANTA|nr:unnamed protein product [Rangifer tarandus platyrhynchus]
MRGEQSRRAALGLQAGVWRVACMPRACAAHSQESQLAQHSPCRSAALPFAGSAHPSQVQAWLCGVDWVSALRASTTAPEKQVNKELLRLSLEFEDMLPPRTGNSHALETPAGEPKVFPKDKHPHYARDWALADTSSHGGHFGSGPSTGSGRSPGPIHPRGRIGRRITKHSFSPSAPSKPPFSI